MNEPNTAGPGAQSAPLSARTVTDLMAERTLIHERRIAEERARGFRPSPGQAKRRAELIRREQSIVAELRRRQAQRYAATDTVAALSPEGHLPTADEADRIEQLTPVPQDDEDAYPHDLP